MSTSAERFTVGQLARRTGVPARTIRFWSDEGLVPPAGRSARGYRLYDAAAAARLDLVRSLRELGLGLAATRAVLSRAATVADVAAAHVTVLDAQIRTLRLRRAVLAAAARGEYTIEETMLMNRLARLSALERQQLIDDFVAGVFAGVAPEAPAMGIARGMRELPDEPAPEQVEAWVELAELVTDEDFRQRIRAMVLAAPADGGEPGPDPQAVLDQAGPAAEHDIGPASAQARAVLDRIVGAGASTAERAVLLARLETFTDARAERYWQLLAILAGRPAPPPAVPAYTWLIEALRASLSQ